MAQLSSKVIFVNQHKTSMRLAAAEWEAIDLICKRENIKRNKLIELINSKKDARIGLTCSVRLFSLIYLHNLIVKYQKNYTEGQQSSPIFEAIKGIL